VTPFSVHYLQTSVKAQIEIGVIVACRTVLHLNAIKSSKFNKMADEQCQMESTAEIISHIASAGNLTKCELCKNLELQLSHVLNELSSVHLIVDLLSKERNCVQRESPSDTTINNQWTLSVIQSSEYI
jgi:hypothetical protein